MTFTFFKFFFIIFKPFLFSLTTTNKISIDFFLSYLDVSLHSFLLFKKSYCFKNDLKIKFNFYFYLMYLGIRALCIFINVQLSCK